MMIVLSSPSGAGKTSLSRELLKENKNLFLSISHTTRPPRSLEVNENDYFFVSDEKFIEMLNQGEFLEHEPAFGLLGIDFGYGFDNANLQQRGPNGWETHFIIGQQF